ncbi:helix-turn-helix transcriptional regulator [Microbacterium sp. K24]|uniref:helix-turn-helix domain-containing protein n=1 Tax=Microbacterium sp. K24 TaxID=2305446 RepID=UPI00109CCC81|nr:helix-turn-helix transcriptional regulator [Microbacterium sp. K24]
MELHASTPEDANTARRFADEVRAELARQRRTFAELALALGTTPQTVGRRLNGDTPFNAIEMALAARFLGIGLPVLWERATAPQPEAVAS